MINMVATAANNFGIPWMVYDVLKQTANSPTDDEFYSDSDPDAWMALSNMAYEANKSDIIL